MILFCLFSLGLFESVIHETVNQIALDLEWDSNYEGRGQEYLRRMHTCYGIPQWSSWACGGHGSCTDQDYCICKVPFKGKNCSEIDYTHPIMSSFVASTDPDTNQTPRLPHCNGIRIDQIAACGEVTNEGIAHFGVCVLDNVCRCYCGWSGINCKDFNYEDYRDDKNGLKPYPDHVLRQN